MTHRRDEFQLLRVTCQTRGLTPVSQTFPEEVR